MTALSTLRRRAATVALRGFRALPVPLRHLLVRSGTPNYTVGAVCVIEHDGQVLMLSQPHHSGWSLPGGLLGRGELPRDAVTREVAEETGLRIDPGDPVATGVNPGGQSVDVIFRVVTQQRPGVRIAHEARRHRWIPLAGLTEVDDATAQILQTLEASGRQARTGVFLDDGAPASDGDTDG